MTLIQAPFTTGLSVSARMAVEIFLRKNQLSTYEQSHQEVVKIEMNSISVPTDMNKNTDTASNGVNDWKNESAYFKRNGSTASC